MQAENPRISSSVNAPNLTLTMDETSLTAAARAHSVLSSGFYDFRKKKSDLPIVCLSSRTNVMCRSLCEFQYYSQNSLRPY